MLIWRSRRVCKGVWTGRLWLVLRRDRTVSGRRGPGIRRAFCSLSPAAPGEKLYGVCGVVCAAPLSLVQLMRSSGWSGGVVGRRSCCRFLKRNRPGEGMKINNKSCAIRDIWKREWLRELGNIWLGASKDLNGCPLRGALNRGNSERRGGDFSLIVVS